jgi:NAD(P)-dependent dehydrogenase (short-subunit alcohol dehydrogenase family)
MSDSRAVLVTGAGGGMGIACARALAGEGTLLLQEIDAARLSVACDTLAGEGIEARMVAGDLLDPSHLSALSAEVAKAGGLRALVHTAGLSPTMAEARRVFDVDLVATARLVDALIPQLGPGSVAVLLASQAGHMVAGAATPPTPTSSSSSSRVRWPASRAAPTGSPNAGSSALPCTGRRSSALRELASCPYPRASSTPRWGTPNAAASRTRPT